jgi:hypothetical protein
MWDVELSPRRPVFANVPAKPSDCRVIAPLLGQDPANENLPESQPLLKSVFDRDANH